MSTAKDKSPKQVNPLTAREKEDAQKLFVSILSEMKKHGLPDVMILRQAYSQALKAHGDTRRKSGEPYIMHPLQVAKILAGYGHESDMVTAAILHDIVEDCDVTKKDLERDYGINIADIVDAVTKVSETFGPEEFLSKQDLEILSDVKFLTESVRVKKAVYIKCADRIHNLRTIGVFPKEKQLAKAQQTRNILVRAAKELHIHNMTEELGDLCLKIENPEQYQKLKAVYEDELKKQQGTLEGAEGLIEETRRMVLEDGRLRDSVEAFEFHKRHIDSIHKDIVDKLYSYEDIEELFRKEPIAIFDVYFISKDTYMESSDNLFFAFYDKLHQSPYKFTIIGHHEDSYETYYIMKDWYGNLYRLFVQSETENLEFTYGQLMSERQRNSHYQINPAEPDAPRQNMITVFRKDNTPMEIVEGATVLDFAFAIDPNVGICAKYAFLNGGMAQIHVRTKLNPGDLIEVVSDHDRDNQINDIPHATVRWFEYLHSREAIKTLSRWLEKHMDSAVPSMPVYDDRTGMKYEIDMASTVLDFAFLVGEQVGLHIKKAYINKNRVPAELDTTLRYEDRVRFEYDPEDQETPVLTWLGIVKTRQAKERLIAYFNGKKDKA